MDTQWLLGHSAGYHDAISELMELAVAAYQAGNIGGGHELTTAAQALRAAERKHRASYTTT